MVQKVGGDGTRLRLVWDESTELPSTFANQIQAVRTESEVYLVFGETLPPNLLALGDGTLGAITIRPSARVVIPAGAFAAVARVIASTAGLIELSDVGSDAE